jgi:hypothetical protein
MGYERKLATPGETRTLRQTEVTRHFLTNRYAPSDVSQIIALLDHNIRQLGFSVWDFPERKKEYTLEEKTLTQELMRPGDNELEPRITHDVDCVAAILTMRAGLHPETIEGAGAIFVTTTGLVVRNVTKWFRDAGETGVSPIAHLYAITSLAWLKKPAAAGRLKLNELAALCSAAVRPSQGVWNTFLQKLRKMEESGTISSPEFVAIVASRLLDSKLAEFDDEDCINAQTVENVVAQVKADYSKEADARIADAKSLAVKEAEARLAAEMRASQSDEARRQLELRIYATSDKIADIVSGVVFYSATVLVILGTALTLLSGVISVPVGLKWAAWIVVGATCILGILDMVWGKSISDYRRDIASRVRQRTRRWMDASDQKTP